MKNIKVLWTHNFNPFSKTSGNFMHQFAEYMRDLGIDIELFYTGKLNNLINIVKAKKKIAKLSRNYDIVHAQFGSACSLISNKGKAKKIVSLRGSDWYRYKGINILESFHSKLAVIMTKVCIRHYDAVITVSKRMAKEVNKNFPSANVYTLPDPINLEEFRPIDRNYARKKLFGRNNNKLYVLFTTVSKKNPVKRLWLAKDAIKIASEELKNIELKIACGISHKLMPLLVPCCDVALLTSTHEGWPNSIKEALACNVPFVATDVSDLAEIAKIEPTCRISQPDPESIAAHLCDVLKKKNLLNLRQHVDSLKKEDACLKLLKIYKKTLNEDNKSAGINMRIKRKNIIF